jgi:hypothetical protein
MAKAMTPLPDTADERGGMLMAYNEKKNIQFYVKRCAAVISHISRTRISKHRVTQKHRILRK